MKIKEALLLAEVDLKKVEIESYKLDALLLLAYSLSVDKEKIIFNPDLEISDLQKNSFFALVKRRALFEPLSQIVGKREFYGRDFLVTKDVLDPRPDSESLIELVLENFVDKNKDLELLEIGVGSGCLIVTLLAIFTQSKAVGLDVSCKALLVAQENALRHEVSSRLELLESDLFTLLETKKKFDLIVSNPPYIPSFEIASLQPEVRLYEPLSALDGGSDGLDFYRKIAAKAKDFLKQDGKVVLEIGFGQENQVLDIFGENGFILIGSKKDLSGITLSFLFKLL